MDTEVEGVVTCQQEGNGKPYQKSSLLNLYGNSLNSEVHRVPGFLSLRPNWVPPPPHPQARLFPPTFGFKGGGRHTSLRGRWGPNADEETENCVYYSRGIIYNPSTVGRVWLPFFRTKGTTTTFFTVSHRITGMSAMFLVKLRQEKVTFRTFRKISWYRNCLLMKKGLFFSVYRIFTNKSYSADRSETER